MMTTTFTNPTGHPVTADQHDVSAHPIVYFDGVCGLCNHFVNLLLDRDRDGKLRFAPLQGETALQQLNKAERENLNSVVFSLNGKNYQHSAAVSRILCQLGGFYGVCGWLLWLIPRPLRDLGYWIVAKTRYRIFGKTESCRMPRPGEAERFLP